jgi:hypothetical protein
MRKKAGQKKSRMSRETARLLSLLHGLQSLHDFELEVIMNLHEAVLAGNMEHITHGFLDMQRGFQLRANLLNVLGDDCLSDEAEPPMPTIRSNALN